MGGKSAKPLKFLDDLSKRRDIDAAFNRYDKDNSGQLSKDEWDLFVLDLVKYFGDKQPDLPVTDLGLKLRPELRTFKDVVDDPVAAFIVRDHLSSALLEVLDTDGDGMISFAEWQRTPWDKIRKDIKQLSTEKQERLLVALRGKWKIHAVSLAEENRRWTAEIEIEDEITGEATNKEDGKTYDVVEELSHVVVNRLLVCFGTVSQCAVKFTIKLFDPEHVASLVHAEGHLAIKGCDSWHEARFALKRQ